MKDTVPYNLELDELTVLAGVLGHSLSGGGALHFKTQNLMVERLQAELTKLKEDDDPKAALLSKIIQKINATEPARWGNIKMNLNLKLSQAADFEEQQGLYN
ncbi:hypothetical protein [Legionella busanensis]|uniref:hypothetical protein n=1 Tax=Legionella busanensis TaxID=190655 RepID=UPI000E1BC404|nr:hypothetical protein [Legionella busanensis]